MNTFKERLVGNTVTLEAFKISHRDGLYNAANRPVLWEYIADPKEELNHFINGYLDTMAEGHSANDPFAYTIISNHSKLIIGSTRYYGISFPDKRLCIGFTWYSPEFWGSKVNPESKLLLLEQCFEMLNLNRVEFHVDSRNERSLGAMKKLGATLECVMKRHKIVQGNFVRDTALLSILKESWPEIKDTLEKRLRK